MSAERTMLPRRGLMFVLSSPSGAGKSTLARLLLDEEKDLTLSISVTTRARRPSEVEGQHYHFIDRPTFMPHARARRTAGIRRGAREFLRHAARARGEGARRRQGRAVRHRLAGHRTALAHRGAEARLVRVFVLPPNFRELRARLERRAEDAPEAIRRRLAERAASKSASGAEYDYVIINEDLDQSFPAARAILAAERLRRERVTGLAGFVDGLLKEADESIGAEVQRKPS